MAGILTRGEVVTEALQLGGNPSLTTRVNSFLNLFLDHLARSFDWQELVTEASLSSSSPIYTFALPADYGRMLAVHIDEADRPLVQVPWPELWQKIRTDAALSTTSSSDPTHFAIEPGTPKAYVWPVPSNTYAGKILYYKIPAEITADATVPWFPHSLALVNACTTYVESYERESLQVLIDRATDDVLRRYANNHFDSGRAGSTSIGMDQNIFGGWNYRES